MIVLDENIRRDEWQKLVAMRIRTRHIGYDIGTKGPGDEQEIIPWLHRHRGSTFFTHDLGFLQQRFCHARYCLDIPRQEAAESIKRFLRHPEFADKASRMGAVVRPMHTGLSVLRANAERDAAIPWRVRGRRS
jgi:hypothetical protein